MSRIKELMQSPGQIVGDIPIGQTEYEVLMDGKVIISRTVDVIEHGWERGKLVQRIELLRSELQSLEKMLSVLNEAMDTPKE